MKPFILIEPQEDGITRIKRFLCPECYSRLEQVNFVQEADIERKKLKNKEMKGGQDE